MERHPAFCPLLDCVVEARLARAKERGFLCQRGKGKIDIEIEIDWARDGMRDIATAEC